MFYLNYQTQQGNYVTGIRTYTDYVLEIRKATAKCTGCPFMGGVNDGMPFCQMMCCYIIETGDCDYNQPVKETETSWVEFETWMDDISICGYMALDEADDDAPLQFYDYNGLECGNHITQTRYPSFSQDQDFKWEILSQWFAETDIVQWLVDFAEEEKICYFKAESEWGRIFDVEFYINCSKLGKGGN